MLQVVVEFRVSLIRGVEDGPYFPVCLIPRLCRVSVNCPQSAKTAVCVKSVSCRGLAVIWSVQLFESRPVVIQCVHVVCHLQS